MYRRGAAIGPTTTCEWAPHLLVRLAACTASTGGPDAVKLSLHLAVWCALGQAWLYGNRMGRSNGGCLSLHRFEFRQQPYPQH